MMTIISKDGDSGDVSEVMMAVSDNRNYVVLVL